MGKLISELDPAMQPRAKKAFEKMCSSEILHELGCETVAISETKRELAVQMAYYARSRMRVEDVKRMYAAAGLHEPTETECKTANTWTLASNHIYGRAIDFVPVKDGKLWWTAPSMVWQTMGEIGEECGLKWGGRWKEVDCPHFEI